MSLLRKLVVLAVIIVIIAGLYPLIVTKATHPAQLSAYDDDPNDLSDLKENLEDEGYSIASLFSSPLMLSQMEQGDQNNSILFIIGVEQSYSEFEASALQEFMNNGGSIVLADDFGYGNTAVSNFQSVGVSLFNKPLYDMRNTNNPSGFFEPGDNASIVHLHATPAFGGNQQYELLWSQATALKTSQSTTEHAWSSLHSFVDLNGNGEGDADEVANKTGKGIPVIVEAKVGKNGGKLMIIADPSMFINDLLDEDDNWEFTRDMVAYMAKGSPSQTTIIFEESRHLQANIVNSIYVELFGWMAYGTGSMVVKIIILATLILGLEFILMRVANPTLYRHTFNPAIGRTSRWRVPHTTYIEPDLVRETFLEKVRITYGLGRDDFAALPPAEIERMVGSGKDPLLVGFVLNKDTKIVLADVLQAMDRWSK